MVLDCDSFDAFLAASHWLKSVENINFSPVQSSKNRYWIVTDFVAPISVVCNKMKFIPGVDNKFVDACCRDSIICIRAVPRLHRPALGPPILYAFTPEFSECTLKNPLARKWYKDFESYFKGGDYAKVYKSWHLKTAILRNEVEALAIDPSFVV
jgi:hypothetical protein